LSIFEGNQQVQRE